LLPHDPPITARNTLISPPRQQPFKLECVVDDKLGMGASWGRTHMRVEHLK